MSAKHPDPGCVFHTCRPFIEYDPKEGLPRCTCKRMTFEEALAAAEVLDAESQFGVLRAFKDIAAAYQDVRDAFVDAVLQVQHD